MTTTLMKKLIENILATCKLMSKDRENLQDLLNYYDLNKAVELWNLYYIQELSYFSSHLVNSVLDLARDISKYLDPKFEYDESKYQ
jgi:hypothetical protein